MLGLSSLARQIQPSATLAAGAKARSLKAQGIRVFDFSLGQPDFRTPEHICQAAVKAMKQGHTGYTPANGIPELRAALADVVLDANLSVLSDEIYERLIYGDARATCFATLRPELVDRTFTVSGASKTYSMTGWRMGWACGPAPAIKAMGDIQSQQTGC